MASSPVKLLLLLLFVCIVGWIVFMFAARLVALLLSRIMGASVGFRISGWNCLRDVNVKFRKGAVESISVGEIKISLRRSLVKLGFGFISKDPKLQLLICDLEITIRQSEQKTVKMTKKSRSSSRGKWMILANIARFLSVSVTDLILKMPKTFIEVKNMGLDLFKTGGSNPTLSVKLHFVPLLLHFSETKVSFDQSAQPCLFNAEKNTVPFVCEDLYVECTFGHDREMGVGIRNVDVVSGDVSVNLSEELFLGRTSKASPATDLLRPATFEQTAVKKSKSAVSLKKNIHFFPEKVSLKLPRLDLRLMHQRLDFSVENNIMGIYLKSSKSQFSEDSGEATSHFDVQMDFSEIHLLSEGSKSLLEILKVAVVTSIDVPMQSANPVRAEIDVKLGGTQCNLMPGRLLPLLQLKQSKKKMVLQEGNFGQDKPLLSESKTIMWTCTVSAPEMNLVLHDVKGLPLYHGSSQSSHLFANNIASRGTQIHAELGELHLYMADEHQVCFKETLFDVEANSGSLVHIARVSLDLGHRELENLGNRGKEQHDDKNLPLVFSVDVTGMGVDLNFVQVESLVVNAISFKTLLSKVSVGKKESKVVNSGKMAKKGVPVFKLNLEQCSIVFSGDVGLEDTVVADPKRVNFGSQGGENIISLSADGTSRQAQITSTVSNGSKYLKNSTCLDIFHLSLCVNKEKQHTRMELERARSVYKEYSEELGPTTNVTLFDVQNAKFVRRPGGLNENSVCSLFSATDITARWEPDVHVALYEVILRLRYLLHNLKLRSSTNETSEIITDDMDQGNESIVESLLHDKQQKKKDSVFAIDIEMLSVSAELADGVDALVQVQSIFSENARIGILLEGLVLSFNEARVFKSSRMQISRLPIFASNNLLDAKALLAMRWDWVIQGLDVHICMPYRLQLRAIEDAVEDTLRGLKLICAAKRNILFPIKNSRAKKVKTGSIKFGSIRFNIRKLRAEIEEEPIQGWLDEHYQLMKNRVCELSSRLKFFDDLVSEGSKYSGTEPNDTSSTKIQHNGVDIDVSDVSNVKRLREEIQEKAFRSYYLACQELVHSGGSGACASGLQAGFKPSTARSSLLSLSATEVDITLNRIEEGDTGMIEFIKNLDPVSLDNDIPFSRLYGRNIVLHTGNLVAQLRNYTFPLFAGEVGKCEGCVVLAQQATCFQPQIVQDVYIGRWRKVCMLRSASGTTPPMKVYCRMPIYFKKGEVSFGVGYEPVFADISYAFTVALRRANLSIRGTKLNMQNMVSSDSSGSGSTKPLANQMAKKERSLPWWDDIRYYIHGNFGLIFQETRWSILGTTNPYENLNKLQIVSGYMEIQHIDGHVTISAKEFKIFVSSLESLMNSCGLKPPPCASGPFLYSSSFSLEVIMEWECESGNPLDHYLHALPNEGLPRSKVYDPFRSTSLSLRWNFSLRPTFSASANRDVFTSVIDGGLLDKLTFVSSEKAESILSDIPTVNMGAHDLMWLFKWWSLLYNPPHKLRSFSRWPRFGIPRVTRSGNLSLDKVMTEFFLRLDATPACIKHVTLGDDDPAGGLTFKMTKLKYELCYSRGLQHYTFNCKREPLDLVYRGLDLHLLKVYINRDTSFVSQDAPKTWKCSQHVSNEGVNNGKNNTDGSCDDKHQDDGFLLSSDYFTIRRQAPMADHARLLAWQDAGRKNLEMTYVRSEFESDQSDEDGYNVVVADNCQRVFVYGLKLLWTIQNRDAVWSWVGAISKAFEPPKPSPSRQYTQRKLIEGREKPDVSEVSKDDSSKSSLAPSQGPNSPIVQPTELVCSNTSTKTESTPSGLSVKNGAFDDEEEGTRHFMVNVIQPQFNLHSEEANGRFLLAAASGHVLARSFHSVLHVGYEEIEKALGADGIKVPEAEPEMTWKRAEFSVMLKHVQAHVAPTDVDPGAGLQWLPKILRNSPEVKRTGALLERVFMPCQMYFRYTRHKGGLADLKVKPLKDLSFNSPNITATMTSRQFQVMLDVLSNLLFARLPKPRKSSLSYPTEDEDIEEEIDEVVPDGVEEVELARINLEQKERERKLLLDDIRSISSSGDSPRDLSLATQTDSALWMIAGSKSSLVQGLKVELGNIQKSRKTASVNLRMALQKAAQIRLMEKEKNKSPSCAMRISMKINKVVWSMLADGKSFAEAEINDMIYDFDRDYKDIGIAQFTIRSFEVRNCLLNAKSTVLLSSWNPPIEWGRNMMLRVDAKQGAPKDGASLLELFQVEIYPLKIYLTETMYRMMWDYFFPEEEQDSQRRQEVWKVSTTAGTRRGRKSASVAEAASNSYSLKDSEAPTRVSASTTRVSASTTTTIVPSSSQSSSHTDATQVTRLQNLKANNMCGSSPELRRTSSFDKISEENMAGSVSNEIVLHVHSSVTSSSKSGPLSSAVQPSHAVNEDTSKAKSKDSKSAKSGRLSHEEKKVGKSQDEKKSRARKMMDFHNIKISQVELLVTYEGSRFAVSELRLLMDTFHRVEFTGTWRRLFSRVKKHIIWGVLKSVTGMQGKKFKDKAQSHKEINGADVLDIDLSDSDGCQPGKSDQLPMWLKRPNDGAGDGFVTSIKGLFNSQRRKAKAFVKRTMRGEPDSDAHADCSGSDVEVSPFARQLTITTKKLIRRGTKKFRPKGQKNSGVSAQPRGSTPSSPTELTPNQSDSSSASPTYKDIPD